MTLKLEFKNPGKIKNFLLRVGVDAKEAARQAAGQVIREAERLAREKIQLKTQGTNSGNKIPFDSVDSRIEDGGFPVQGQIFLETPQTDRVEFGKEPSGIRTRGKTDFPRERSGENPVKEKRPAGDAPFKVLNEAAGEAVQRTGEFVDEAMKRKFNN